MAFAENTSVPVDRSRAEIEQLISKFGCTKFATMLDEHHAVIGFVARGRAVRFLLPLPDPKADQFRFKLDRYSCKKFRTPDQAREAFEQEQRRLWRALALVIKAKLEAVESGITTFEHEFLAHFLQPNGMTIGDSIIPKLDQVAMGKATPMLLLAGET
jgi:hypothetical protein